MLKDYPDARKRKYDYEANYEQWIKIKDRFQIRQYLFGAFPEPFASGEMQVILFVNIEMTLRTLLKFYDNFRRVLGYDFDPFAVVFEVENKDSAFWNSVLKEHALLGILVGYGLDNSWFFQWNMQYMDAKDKNGAFVRSLPSGFDTNEDIANYDAQHFNLPIFRLFGLHQNVNIVKHYQKEREAIKRIYKGKDEVDVTLQWLTR